MPLFSYTAINAENQRVSGTVEAISLQAARDALKEMHLVPEEIHEGSQSAPATAPELSSVQGAATIPDDVATAPEQSSMRGTAARIAAIPSNEPSPTTDSFDIPPSSVAGHPAIGPEGPSGPEREVRGPRSEVLPSYFPLLDTLRLYAGWLLAWYGFVYALGSYQHFRRLPFTVPYVEGLFLSPLVLSFTLGAFLFLLLTGIWKAIGRGILSGFALTIVGIAAFVLYRMNVV